MICSVSHCKRSSSTSGYCLAHYQRVYRKLDPETLKLPFRRRLCSLPGCDKEVKSNSLCHNHLRRAKRGEIPAQPEWKITLNPECSISGCSKGSHSIKSGMCHSHARYAAGDRRPAVPVEDRRIPQTGLPCPIADCQGKVAHVGLCTWHWSQKKAKLPFTVMPVSGERECVYLGCERGSFYHEYCVPHRRQMQFWGRYFEIGDPWHGLGKPAPKARPPKQIQPSCEMQGCERRSTVKSIICVNHRFKARKYGLSNNEMIILFMDAYCASCGTKDRLVVDHDHACCSGEVACGNCVRGVLCSNCNTALGFLKDDYRRANGLGDYMQSNSILKVAV